MKYLGKQSIFDDLMIGGVLLTPPDPATYSYELTLPNDDGTAGQLLTTDGNGVLTWTTAAGSGVTMTNGVDNRVMTATGAASITGEANFLFDYSNALGYTSLLLADPTVAVGTAFRVSMDGSQSVGVHRGIISAMGKSGVTGSGVAYDARCVVNSITDSATNDANSDSYLWGVTNTLTHNNSTGDTKQIGIYNALDGATTQYGLQQVLTGGTVGTMFGIWQKVDDGAMDLKFVSSDLTTDDYFSIATGANGATTFTTVDGGNGGADLNANLDFNIDGTVEIATVSGKNITLDSGASVYLEGAIIQAEYSTSGVRIRNASASASYYSQINVTGIDGARIHTLPNATGTLALTSDIPAAYTLPLATTSVRGGVELGSDTDLTETYETGGTGTSSRTYPVQLNAANQMGVSVPWTDNNTTYTAGDGLDLSGTEFSTDLKSNGGLVIESTELAVDLGASSITGTLAVGDGGTGLTTVGTDNILTGNGTGALTSEADLRFYGGDTLAIGSNSDSGTDNIQRSPAGTDIDGGSLDIEAGNARPGTGNNRAGGDLNLKPGLSTGTGGSGKLNIYTGWEGVSGTGQLGPAVHSQINSTAAANYFTIYEPNVATTDYFRTTVVGGGATTLATYDGSGGQTGSLVFDVDGLIDIDAARNGLVRFMFAGTQYGEITAAGSKSSFYLYEAAGASTDDWFRIETNTHGATEIATKDNTGANAANLTLTIEGAIELNADGNSIMFKDGTTEIMEVTSNTLKLISMQGIQFEGTPDSHETILAFTDPTADRTITLPNASGTVALTSDITNTTISGTTANGIATYGGANQIDIESSLTYTSNTLSHNGNFTIDVGNSMTIDVDSGQLNIQDAGVQKVKLGGSGLDFTDNTAAEITFEGSTDDTHKTVINVTDPTGSRTCTFPDASGTVALVENTARQIVSLRTDDAYVMYLGNVNRWYQANRVFSSIGTQSTLDGASVVDSIAITSASYIAIRPCTVHSIVVSWYPSATSNVEFEILKVPLVDDSISNVTYAQMTHTNHDGSYTANRNYVKTFAITGGNTLTAGQGIAFCARRTSGSNTYMNGGQIYAEIEITG